MAGFKRRRDEFRPPPRVPRSAATWRSSPNRGRPDTFRDRYRQVPMESPHYRGEEMTVRLIPRIDYQNIGGLADKVVGLTREVAGMAFDNEDLIRAGEAQQGKGSERLKELRAQTKARAHHEQARAQEDRQRDAQSDQRGGGRENAPTNV
jgi:uncharacterized protein YjbJ (UPF0337 family)